MNTTNHSFISKKINYTLSDEKLSSLPVVVRSQDLDKIYHAQQLIDAANLKMQERDQAAEVRIQQLEVDTKEKAKKEGLQQMLSAIELFQNNQEQYFNSLEIHCANIVKHALTSLLGEVSAQQQIYAAIIAASKLLKDETAVTLRVHPNHKALASTITSEKNWQFKSDASIDPDLCHLEVALGAYRSSFKESTDMLIQAIDQSLDS